MTALAPIEEILATPSHAAEIVIGVNRVLDLIIDERVALHRDRAFGHIDVSTYLAGLQACRVTEAILEETRRRNGATCSRAFELVITEAPA